MAGDEASALLGTIDHDSRCLARRLAAQRRGAAPRQKHPGYEPSHR